MTWSWVRANRGVPPETAPAPSLDQPAGGQAARREGLAFDQFRLGFRPGLDGLRALAILTVLAIHATFLWEPKDAAKFLPGGYISVDVFFALSGFLITSLLLGEVNRTGRLSLRGFYRRRALRLLPVLYALLIVQLIYTLIVGDSIWYTLKGTLLIVFYVSNWAQVFHLPQPFGTEQTWSLGVEEQFYLLWPLLLIGITKIKSRRVAIAPFALLIGIALVTRELLWHFNVPFYTIYVQTEVRLDVLMTGSLLAYLLHTGWRPGPWATRAGYLSFIFLGLMVAFAPVDGAWLYHLGGFTIIAFAAAAVVLLAADSATRFSRVLAWPPLQAVGRRTYSLYIVHYLIYLAVVRAWPTHTPFERLAVGLALTAVVSEIFHRAFEKPFLAIKNRTSNREATGPADAKMRSAGTDLNSAPPRNPPL
jgi:peptidoglycan/LPS O-acetylase OafA/YrhL